MKRVRILSVIAVVVVLMVGTVYVAFAGGNKNPAVLPPNSRVQGLTHGEWSARWWQYVLSIPTPQNPLEGGTGDHCVFHRIENVGLVAFDVTLNEVECEVPVGMILLLDILSAECSTVEEDPFYGGNEEELRACALGFTITDLQASIDGLDVKNMDQYIHTSPLFEFTLPEDNILFTDELSGQSVSHGAILMLAPLNPGEHTIYLHASIPELEFTVDTNIELTVAR